MPTTKILILAGLAALTLSGGAANAQNLTPSFAEATYETARNHTASSTIDRVNGQLQSSLSDTDVTRSSADHGATFLSNHHLFGVGGAGG
jgi:hypothetical protein